MANPNDDFDALFISGQPHKIKSDDGDFTPIGAGKKFRSAEDTAKPAQPKKKKNKPASAGASQNKPHSRKKPAAAKKTSSDSGKRSSVAMTGDNPGKTGITSEIKPKKKTTANKRKKSSGKNKASFKEEILSIGYVGAMAVGGGVKKVFGSKKGRILAGALLVVILLFCCWKAALSIYKSNTILSGNNNVVDDNAGKIADLENAGNKDDATYFLIVGVDKDKQLTDCIWVLCFDNKAHKMNVLQIPRDTYVGEYSMSPHKANAVYESKVDVNWCENCDRAVTDDKNDEGRHTVCGGKITTKKTQGIASLYYFIANELHLPIDYYVFFDFEGFEKAIDALGGVDIVLEKDMKVYYTKSKSIDLYEGKNHLNGADTLKFMRNRKIYADGDLGRIKAQRQIIHAILDKVQGMSVLQTFNVVLAANGSFSTDMSPENIKSFIAPLKKCKSDDLHMFELPGKARMVRRSSYYICDEEKTVELLNEYMLPYSQKLQAGDIDFPKP